MMQGQILALQKVEFALTFKGIFLIVIYEHPMCSLAQTNQTMTIRSKLKGGGGGKQQDKHTEITTSTLDQPRGRWSEKSQPNNL